MTATGQKILPYWPLIVALVSIAVSWGVYSTELGHLKTGQAENKQGIKELSAVVVQQARITTQQQAFKTQLDSVAQQQIQTQSILQQILLNVKRDR